jgi:hypothetical protein
MIVVVGFSVVDPLRNVIGGALGNLIISEVRTENANKSYGVPGIQIPDPGHFGTRPSIRYLGPFGPHVARPRVFQLRAAYPGILGQ